MSTSSTGQNPALKGAGVSRAQFGELGADGRPTGTAGGDMSLDLIMDVAVSVALEVGRTTISVRELLQLTPGTIVELDRLAGEPLDVLVNGIKVARGEVVVVNDKFGIRVTDVVPPAERVANPQAGAK
jgi:flagellar motor switch protein FliN/FliY